MCRARSGAYKEMPREAWAGKVTLITQESHFDALFAFSMLYTWQEMCKPKIRAKLRGRKDETGSSGNSC